jgi:hypothetical protein
MPEMTTSKPMSVIRACVTDCIVDNRFENAHRPPGSPEHRFTVHDIVSRYGLDAGTYWHEDHHAHVGVAEQLVRNEVLSAYRQGLILRVLGEDNAPKRRDGEFLYVAS